MQIDYWEYDDTVYTPICQNATYGGSDAAIYLQICASNDGLLEACIPPHPFFFLTRGRVGKLQVFEHWGEFSLLYRRCMEGELRVGNGDGSVHKHG